MPGHEGDIWLSAGTSGLWHSTDGGTTFTQVANVTEARSIGFGMAALGKSYMALYTLGTISGVEGVFRSDDAGATWIQINDSQHQYGATCCVTGDPRVYGRVYFGTNGLGIIYGDIAGSQTTPTPGTTPTVGTTPTTTPPTPTPTKGTTPTPTSTPRPTPTAGTTPTPTPTATPSSGGTCKVNYMVQSQWPGGFTGSIIITNTGAAAINGWTLKFAFANGQQVTQGWNGTFSQQGSQVTIQSLSYNGSLAASGGSTSLGFNGSWTGSNTNPTSFTLNGATCSTS
jgi:hypothetical protein